MKNFFVNTTDVSAASVGIAVWTEYLPHVAGLFTVLWIATRLYDWTEAKVKRFIAWRKSKKETPAD